MYSPEIYALLGTAAVSALPLIVGPFLLFSRNAERLVFVIVSLSVGALFGDAFLHLIPDSLERMPAPQAGLLMVAGILFLFTLEKFMHWRHEHIHRHDPDCEHATLPVGHLSLVAEGMHNFLDGVIIATSFLTSISAGIATTIAVILHEIPQEIGDIGILLHAGFSKRKALLYNFYSGLTALAGAGIALIIGASVENAVSFIIPFAAGNFIYIAGSDLVPELHKTKHPGQSLVQLAAMCVGIGLMAALLFME